MSRKRPHVPGGRQMTAGDLERFTLPSARRQATSKSILIGMLMYRSPHPDTMAKVIQTMFRFNAIAPWYDVAFRSIAASSPWWGRGQLLKQFIELGEGCTHLWCVDDDMDWPEGVENFNAIAHLMARKKDMVGGLGFKRQMPTLPYVGRAAANGWCQNILELELLDGGKPFWCDFIGFGMVLISRKTALAVVEACGGNYDATFGTELAWDASEVTVEDIEKFLDMRKDTATRLVDPTLDPMRSRNEFVHLARKIMARSQPFGEDYSFCVKVRRAGHEIWCDPSFELLHNGDYKYGLKDFIYQQKRGTMKLVDKGEGDAASA